MKRKMWIYITLSVILLVGMYSLLTSFTNLQTVPFVDLEKYSGKWYEIASYPQRFQKGCHCSTAEYTPTDKGYIIVENKCNKDSINGIESSIQGKAFITKNSGNVNLKFSFFGLLEANIGL